MNGKVFQRRNWNGRPVSVGEVTVTPQAQSFSVRLPFGGVVWNRPAGVLVERNGRSQHIPIRDRTRLVVVMLAGLSAVIAILSFRSVK